MPSNIRAILVCLLAYVCFDLMAVHVRFLSARYSPQELSVYRNVLGVLPTVEGFSMRATAQGFGVGLTLARVDKPLKEEAVGC